MNIFKIGLLLSVLVFNLSCAIIPEDIEFNSEESAEKIYAIDDQDLNVQDQSFINLEDDTKEPNIDELVNYLSHHGIYNESSIAELDNLPSELSFTPDELDALESSIHKFETSSLQKQFLHSFVSFLRTEAN